jgi:hypothetical protein
MISNVLGQQRGPNMTSGFLKTLESMVIHTSTDGEWRIRAGAHQGGAALKITPCDRSEDTDVLFLILYVTDQDEQYTGELECAISKWITETTARPSVARFNPSSESLESWQVHILNDTD